METKHYILIGLLLWNLTVFFLYAMDKYRARHGSWRVSERALVLSAFCMGGIGAAVGMFLLRHKTRHLKFRVLIPLSLILTITVAAFFLWPEAFARIHNLFFKNTS